MEELEEADAVPTALVRATARAGAGKGLRRQDAVRMDHGPALRLGITTHAHGDHPAHASLPSPDEPGSQT
jgi:hypothetical protein